MTATLEATRLDRCDRCGVIGYVHVQVHATELWFCAHHFAKHEAALAASGAEILGDHREQL